MVTTEGDQIFIILTSKDGQSWTVQAVGGPQDIFKAVFGDSTFIVVGGSGTILQSEAIAQD